MTDTDPSAIETAPRPPPSVSDGNTVAIADLVIDPTIQIRRSNRREAIDRYVEAFDNLPPIVAFRTPEGELILSDGFHRTAAGQLLGAQQIKADVREGTREDALEYAVIANTQSGEPLTTEERDDGIRRLKQLHPQHSQEKIASLMSVSQQTVSRIFLADEVRRRVMWKPVHRVPDSVLATVAAAPVTQWAPLLKAADKAGWDRDQLGKAVKVVNDDDAPEDLKAKVLEGDIDPTHVGNQVQGVSTALADLGEKPGKGAEPALIAHEPDWDEEAAEHLQPVVVEITFIYRAPSNQTRMRGMREYRRESQEVRRSYTIQIPGGPALQSLGDPTYPQGSNGFVMVLREIQRRLWKYVSYEGWPTQERTFTETRPGA